MSETEILLASIIKENSDASGKVSIAKVKNLYNTNSAEGWSETQFPVHGTLSKFFRTNKNFTFHRVAAGKHLCSVSPSFKFTAVPLKTKKKKKVIRKVIKKVRRKKNTGKGAVKTGSTKNIGEVKKKLESNETKSAISENKNLKKIVEGMESTIKAKDKEIGNLKESNTKLKMELQESQKLIKSLREEIKTLKESSNVSANYGSLMFIEDEEKRKSIHQEMVRAKVKLYEKEKERIEKEKIKEIEKKDVEEKDLEEEGEETADFSFFEEYTNNKCELVNPSSVLDIKKGEKNKFVIKVPNGLDVAIVIDDDHWNYLEKKDNTFSGELLIEKEFSFVDIFAKFKAKEKFHCLASCTL